MKKIRPNLATYIKIPNLQNAPIIIVIIALFILNLIFVSIIWNFTYNKQTPQQSDTEAATEALEEIALIESKDWSFETLKIYFQDLSDQKGADYAFEVLKLAPLPPNIDLHLLGHVVGDKLYQQKGIGGISLCTQDLRNACSHSIVVGYFLEKGEAGLRDIAQTCRNAPGGVGAYTMCFHGLGHGILAYKDYNLEEAVKICNKTGTDKYRNREAIECIGGAIMEIIGGGGHNRELWKKQNKNYLSSTDPLFPCNSEFMPENARNQCLNYLTPHLFILAEADLGYPESEDIEAAFQYCLRADKKEQQNACFGGFGKEFVVLAQNRDVRKIDQMQSGQLLQVYEWCELANNEEGIKYCLEQAINSLFWGGENNPQVSIDFCGVIPNSTHQTDCYSNLFANIKTYIKNSSKQRGICQKLPESALTKCLESITKT